MRISLAVSALLVSAAFASPFIPVQQQQGKNVKSEGIAGIVSYFKSAMKMSGFQRRQIEKEIDTFDGQINDTVESASNSVSYIAYQQGSSYIYQPVAAEVMKTYVISEPPQPSFVYEINPVSSASSSESAQITFRPLVDSNDPITKVQISNGDIYFSQTDSFTIPDLSSFPSDSPYIRNWPEIPDEAPPKIGLPSESSEIA
ncbi:hypothetical protein [Parasitella parasitica]|uniref:Uncharacterized protein n=1 Tax=Parasitella parasitica TaxID=35722 RepID=A0A0B7MPL0_9FUNG|nr:hypothetical protein [Parasitella parasitica]